MTFEAALDSPAFLSTPERPAWVQEAQPAVQGHRSITFPTSASSRSICSKILPQMPTPPNRS